MRGRGTRQGGGGSCPQTRPPRGTSPQTMLRGRGGGGETARCGRVCVDGRKRRTFADVPAHEAAATREERAHAARRKVARKLKLLGFKSSNEDLILTNPQQVVGDADAANVVHPVAAAALPDNPTGRPAAPPCHDDLERTQCYGATDARPVSGDKTQ